MLNAEPRGGESSAVCARGGEQTVAAVLATVTHHSHSKVGTANAALRGQKTGTSTRVGPAEYYELSSNDGRPTGGERPEALSEPWPQGKLLRHAGVGYEIVLSLDVPVPQMGEQLPNIVQFLAAQLPVVAEPVIEVPKILLDRTPQRLGDRLRRPQMVEQLVDVPTVVSYSSLQQLTAEQIVDFPVPGRAGGGRGGRGGLQGFAGQGSTAFFGADRVDILGGGLQGSLPGSASSSRSLDGAGQRVFALFPEGKSAGSSPHSGSELSADFNPSTLSAHQMPPEQFVDVPVPQVHERSSSSLLLEVLRWRQQVEEAARWREQIALLAEEEVDKDEEEEEVVGSRFLPHFRPRRWCWYVQSHQDLCGM